MEKQLPSRKAGNPLAAVRRASGLNLVDFGREVCSHGPIISQAENDKRALSGRVVFEIVGRFADVMEEAGVTPYELLAIGREHG